MPDPKKGPLEPQKLTKRVIEALEPRGQAYVLWDTEIRGFGVRVLPSGTMTFFLKYVLHGRQAWANLGRFREVTVDQARKLADTHRGSIAQGEAPVPLQSTPKASPIVSDLIARFMEEHVEAKRAEGTQRGYRRILTQCVEPVLGKMLVRDVTSAETSHLHNKMKATPRQANLALSILRKMFTCAELWNLRPPMTNPCIGIERYPETKRERYLSLNELLALGEVLDDCQRDLTEPLSALLGIRLILLTGARHNEVMKLRWRQVDLDGMVLKLASTEHKSGTKTGGKLITLNEEAIKVLKAVQPVLGNPYVFPGKKVGGYFVGLQHVWERIRARVDARESAAVKARTKNSQDTLSIKDVRIHDLRHTFASHAVINGADIKMVATLLGHVQLSSAHRYAHLSQEARRLSSNVIGGVIGPLITRKVQA